MKKATVILLCTVFLFLQMIPLTAKASTDIVTEYLENGDRIVITTDIRANATPESDSATETQTSSLMQLFSKIVELFRKLFMQIYRNKTAEKTKTLYYYASDNKLLWTATLDAQFRYSSSAAICTDAKLRFKQYDTDWELTYSECSKNANTATAVFAVQQTKLGVPLRRIEKTLTLTCDTNGKIE